MASHFVVQFIIHQISEFFNRIFFTDFFLEEKVDILPKTRMMERMITVYRSQLGSHGKGLSVAKPSTFTFPAGEVGLKFDPNQYHFFSWPADDQTIVARITNSNDFMELVMATSALRNLPRYNNIPINLFLPYFPYSRQDRVCEPGEAFSLKAFAGLINSLGFKTVTTLDPHSDVLSGVVDNFRTLKQIDIIGKFDILNQDIINSKATFVAPDAGANKKTSELAKYFGHSEFIRADKLRDLSNGKIKETIVYADRLDGRTIIIADDICDGGASFTALTKVLKEKGAAKVFLYVTHGIFSKGVKVLFDAGIDKIYTTNSYSVEHFDNVTTLEIELFFT